MTRPTRKQELSENHPAKRGKRLRAGGSLDVQHRSNITLARLQDESRVEIETISSSRPRGLLAKGSSFLNVVELFAGAGGMGLGFILAKHAGRRFRLIFSGEVHPIYVETLKCNHGLFSRMQKPGACLVPEQENVHPIDLERKSALEHVASVARAAGGAHVLIGGPPCQGFSSANRNSWSSDNPNNRLVDVFMRYVDKLRPPVFLMENVQGIVWTAKNGNNNTLSVAEYVLGKMKTFGYLVFPKLLDAVWYGVPQYRTRFFLMGIHRDTGYCEADFDDWGPFPTPTHGRFSGRPFVTTREAIGDLPTIGNGHSVNEMDYCEPATKADNEFLSLMRKCAPKREILDHVTSRHADYVIDRYKRIPAGGNWQDISEMMSNYAQLERTHSNIYRRLKWDEPSITIGHYRKSMLVHPEQHRGLSLREACRLQSFPDWFRFVGTLDGRSGGLMHKQQQLANAVCPLVSKAIAKFMLEL